MDNINKPAFLSEKSNDAAQQVTQRHDPDDVWKIIYEHLKLHSSARILNSWYKGVYLSKVENGIAELSCDNSMKREWIETNHRAFIRNKISEVIGYKPDLVITLRNSVVHEKPKESGDVYEYYDPKNSLSDQVSIFTTQNQSSNNSETNFQSQNHQTSGGGNFSSNLNPKYTLNHFIVGSGNQLAFAVAEGVIDKPGTAYNPLFFYGPSGVGKTHLMQSIGNAMLIKNPGAKILYAPIESFMNDLIESIRTRKTEEFRQKYRPLDLLILDDIQFISTFKKTKEELFNTFNALYEANKQIIIASDRPPKEIQDLPDRLRTRFEGGMVVDIHLPDFETRLAIIRQKEIEHGVELPTEIEMFIAENIESSIRELEGAITKAITQMKFSPNGLSLDTLAKMLQVDIDTKRKRIKPEDILTIVSESFNVTVREIKGKRRTAYVAMARQIVMYLLREELELPLDKVARLVNRKDHTTVIHAHSKVESLMNSDANLKDKIELCRSSLKK